MSVRTLLLTLPLALLACRNDRPEARPARPEPAATRQPAPASQPTSQPAPAGAGLPTQQELQRLYVAGKLRQVVQGGNALLEQQPHNKTVMMMVGASSCYLKDEAGARAVHDKLSPANRNLLENVCRRNGIELRAR